MSILVVGLNHRSAPSALLERVAVPADERGKAVAGLAHLDHVLEAVVLSTCLRVEVYAQVTRYHAGLQEVLTWLADRGDVDVETLEAAHYAHYDDAAASHLFTVACGLDSLIVGEHQVALQVRDAFAVGRDEGTVRRLLLRLGEQATRVVRRVRAETDLARNVSSMVDVGIDLAARAFDGVLAGRTVLVVGTGQLGGLAVARLTREGARLLVWNRNADAAERLAARHGGHVAPTLSDGIAAADVVITATGAAQPLLDADLVAAMMRTRQERRLVLLDLAMPRNIDPQAAQVPGVLLIDLDAVRAVADTTVTGPTVDAARAIVDDEAARFTAWLQANKVEPTIRALREQAETIRRTELDRLIARVGPLDDRQREALEAATQRIVKRLLHRPTVRLKELADAGGAEHVANALRELFELDE